MGRLSATNSKDLQNGTTDGTLVTLVKCNRKRFQGVCLQQLLGDRWEFVQRNKVGSRKCVPFTIKTIRISSE